MDTYLAVLTLVTALGCALNAGVFFAFSGFVMRALARLRPAEGIAAMQAINVAAVTAAFMAALFGTAALCVALIVAGLLAPGEPFAPYLIGGSAVYLAGTIGLTIAYHVPRNNALAGLDPHGAEAERRWATYHAGWTAWNHLRAGAALAAAALLLAAVQVG